MLHYEISVLPENKKSRLDNKVGKTNCANLSDKVLPQLFRHCRSTFAFVSAAEMFKTIYSVHHCAVLKGQKRSKRNICTLQGLLLPRALQMAQNERYSFSLQEGAPDSLNVHGLNVE